MPTSGGLGVAVKNGKDIGCTAVQVFTSSPQQWKAKAITDKMVNAFKEARKETEMGALVSHDSYLVNLAAPNDEIRQKSLAGLKDELCRCSQYGIPYAVSHMGAHLGLGEEEGLRRVAEYALLVLEDSPDDVSILMETTAGQGSSLNYKFDHLATLLDLCHGHPRLCVCLDTCHIFAAGYDIRTKEGYEAVFAEFGQKVGFDRLKAIHCNDSKKALGTRVDRHEHIGEGFIGLEAFRCLVNDKRLETTPIILETPEAPEMHKVNLERLRSLIAA